jgi:hypothetical protein
LTDFLGRRARCLAISNFFGLLFVFFLFEGMAAVYHRDSFPAATPGELVASAKKSSPLVLSGRKRVNLPGAHLTEQLPIATAALFLSLLPRGLSHFRFLAVKSQASSFWK